MLYIHIPFCDSKCNYCAFCSYVSFNYLKEDYMKALIIELKYHLKNKKTKNTKKANKILYNGSVIIL